MPGNAQLSALSYAARPRVVLKYLGMVAVMAAGLTAVPAAVAWLHGEAGFAVRLLAVAALLSGVGAILGRIAAPGHLQINEALAVTSLTFLLVPIALTWPFMAAGLNAVDAFFEALSAVTTTGLTTLGSVEQMPPGFLFARSWVQWYGGLGIVILSVALLAGHSIASRRLLEPGTPGEDLFTTTRIHARRVLVVYLALTGMGTLLTLATPLGAMEAVAHALSAVSTGGFSTYDQSLQPMPPVARAILVAIGICGALSLPLYYTTYMRGWRAMVTDAEFRALAVALALAGLLVTTLTMRTGDQWGLLDGLLLACSAQTTTGFSTVDLSAAPSQLIAALLPFMAVGGSIGSTSGGIKLLRVLILSKLLTEAVRRTTVPPHAVVASRLGGRRLETGDMQRAVVVLLLFALTVLLSWLMFVGYGYDPLDALFDVVSATGTVGLSTGVTGPELPTALKAVLCFDMLAGRVEFVALLVVLYPGTWFGKRTEAK